MSYDTLGTEQGINFLDWHVADTNINTATDQADLYWNGWTYYPMPGNTAGGSIQITWFAEIAAGSWTNVQTGGFNAAIDEYTASTGVAKLRTVNAQFDRPFASSKLGMNRLVGSFTPGASTEYFGADSGIVPNPGTNGLAFDITARIGWTQVEAGQFPTTPILNATGASSRSADVVTSSANCCRLSAAFGRYTARHRFR